MFDYAPLGDPLGRDEAPPSHRCGGWDCTPDCFTFAERTADPTIDAHYAAWGFLPATDADGAWIMDSDERSK